MKSNAEYTITKNSVRKVKNQPADFKVSIEIINDITGASFSKSFFVTGSKAQAHGQRKMQLANLTRKADAGNI